jgi:hypothetical protein
MPTAERGYKASFKLLSFVSSHRPSQVKDCQTANMASHMSSSPHTLSLFYNGQPMLELDILSLFMRAFLITNSIFVLFWLREAGNCPFIKAVKGLLARLDDYFELPPSSDSNYNSENGIENCTADNADNAGQDTTQHSSLSSEATSGVPSRPPILCPACEIEIKALRPSSSKISSALETLASGSAISDEYIEITIVDINPLSYAKAALTSLADDLEFDVSHLTHAEADDMLAELQALRSTVGSRASLFSKPSTGPIHDPDAWYGEACLIDALMWLLRKRIPVQRGEHLEFSGFEPGKEGKGTGEKEKSEVEKSEGHEYGNTKQPKDLEMQSGGEDESENGRTTSGSHRSGHVKPAPSIEAPSPASSRYHKVVPTAREVIYSVNNGLSRELQDFSSSQIDTLLGRLKRRREKVIATGHCIIMSSRCPSFDAGLTELREYAAEKKAQVNAHVALVDGIMLAIRQQCNSSQSPLTENSCYTWSDYASDRDESIRDEMSPLIFSRRFWSGGPDMSFTSRQE